MRGTFLPALALTLFLGMLPGAVPAAEPGYDARLSGYDYPFPVHFLGLDVQRQALEMAFMDVRSERPNGRTVVLLHGKNFSGAYWERTIEALTAEGYRVIAPDQIGFGKSSKPRAFQFSFHALATHTRRLLDDLGVRQATVLGHSMGGMLAARFALMFPERTRKLVLVNPIGLEDWKRKVPYRTVEEWYRLELKKTPERIKAYMRERYFDGDWKPTYQELLEIQAGWVRGPDRKRIAWVAALADDMVFTQPVLYELSEIRVPTLLLIGQEDRTALGKNLVSPEVAEKLGNYPALGKRAAREIPNSTLVELEDVGHVPHYEAWKAYIGALKAFLENTE
ncbi:alpha/beta fold hydrolase [Thiohalorhabdus methylotrophus]|uniref:Alpha/beta fold hydrolase n=1 Tax=Thiohalorhabdus methylotrophus TaxID=3242694 RepID=A0ABV4TS32_9GAMM